jgi:hypothetical protein
MIHFRLHVWLLVILGLFTATPLWAQNNNFNNPGGIRIDAGGVVSILAPARESAAAAKKRQQAFLSANLSPDLAKTTVTRRVSLKQLDQQLAELVRDGKEIPLELRYLAGITQIEQVIIDREAADLSILGPAEGFAPDLSGRMRGITTGRPVLNLEDLLVAWRAVQGGQTTVICSIDPKEEGIAAFKAYSSQNQVAATPAAIAQIFQTMAERLGRQTITLSGVPRDSHFAMVLVEADLRMKRIALGKDPAGVRGVPSHLSLMRLGDASMTRWWFVPLYDPIGVNAERTRFELSGQRLQLLGQDEYTNFQGQRAEAASNRLGTTKFVKEFTDHIPQMVEVQPSFAELQNLFDWMVVCTLIERQKLAAAIDWSPTVLGESKLLPVATYPVPEGVDAVAATNKIGRTTLGLVGGVELNVNNVVTHTTPLASDRAKPIPTPHESRVWND